VPFIISLNFLAFIDYKKIKYNLLDSSHYDELNSGDFIFLSIIDAEKSDENCLKFKIFNSNLFQIRLDQIRFYKNQIRTLLLLYLQIISLF
jgi:hypothetical protein